MFTNYIAQQSIKCESFSPEFCLEGCNFGINNISHWKLIATIIANVCFENNALHTHKIQYGKRGKMTNCATLVMCRILVILAKTNTMLAVV